MNAKRLQHILMFVTCLVVLLAVAARRDGKLLGHALSSDNRQQVKATTATPLQQLQDGTYVINTTLLGKDILGYGGPVPLEIYMKEGKIQKVNALRNSESEDFFAEASSLLTRWNGKTPKEALTMKVDGVSGATYSSRAIIANMRLGLQYADKNASQPSVWEKMGLSWKYAAGLIVVLMGAILPLFFRNKRYRTLQLILNVIVLGFWSGTFISYSLITGYLANGVNLWTSLIPLIMLITAFIYPFFGKKNYYCNNICPCGSMQDLAGKLTHRKWKMSQQTVKRLTLFRQLLWACLMAMMLVGVGFSWMDYELFAAFILQSASWVVLALAVVFFILAIFVPRPYCRFICPTGTLFKLAEGKK
uniref:FMN-binding domain-containing protein n=1 Tax=Prevotella sp. GTC17253 TaxID=3236793 RepID=A0AB33IWG5_9BACT